MAQVKVYGLKTLNPFKQRLSDIIHSCVVDALGFPWEKRFHRFILLDKEDFLFPPDRTDSYLIVEISLFEGRSVETKKNLIRTLFEQICGELGISSNDLEITLFETPKANWGIRGMPGDELNLNYKVEV
jgi:phenylpyruvate tautomerase PptA (4-oxalocrotonate tautomerase family)